MAKHPPSYANLEIPTLLEGVVPDQAQPGQPVDTSIVAEKPVALRTALKKKAGRPPVVRSMRDAASPVMLYLHPVGHKALKRYALEKDGKVHDLLIEAVEEWAKRKGIREPMKVDTSEG